MKTQFKLTLMISLCVTNLSCSPDEQREWSRSFPKLSAATQATEDAQQRMDPVTQEGEAISRAVQDVASNLESLGIPGAGLIALAASVLGTVLGVYNERRRGTIPMKSALEQVVQSVEAAFPQKSDAQKAALGSKQDRATRRVVSQIKGE